MEHMGYPAADRYQVDNPAFLDRLSAAYTAAVAATGATKIAATAIVQPGTPSGSITASVAKSANV